MEFGYDFENSNSWSNLSVQEPMPLFSGIMNVSLQFRDKPTPQSSNKKSKNSTKSSIIPVLENYRFLISNMFSRKTITENGKTFVEKFSTVSVQGDGVYLYDLRNKRPIFSYSIPPSMVLSCPAVSLIFADNPDNVFGRQYAVVSMIGTADSTKQGGNINDSHAVWHWPIHLKASKTEKAVTEFSEPIACVVPDSGAQLVYVGGTSGTVFICNPMLETVKRLSLEPMKESSRYKLYKMFSAGVSTRFGVSSCSPKVLAFYYSEISNGKFEWKLSYFSSTSKDNHTTKELLFCTEFDFSGDRFVNVTCFSDRVAFLMQDKIIVCSIGEAGVTIAKQINFAEHGFQLTSNPGAKLATNRVTYLDKGYIAVVLNKAYGKGAKLSGDLLTVWDGEYGTLQYAKPLCFANFDGEMTNQALVDLSSTFNLSGEDDGATLVACAAVNPRISKQSSNSIGAVLYSANAEIVRYDVPQISLQSCVGKMRHDVNFAKSSDTIQTALQESLEALQTVISQGNVGKTEQHTKSFVQELQNTNNRACSNNRAQVVSFINAAFRSMLVQIDMSRKTKSGGYWPVQSVQLLLETGLVSSMMVNRAIIVPMIAEKNWSLIQMALEQLVDVGELELVALTDALCQDSMRVSLCQWSSAPSRSGSILGSKNVADLSESQIWLKTVEFFCEKMYWDRSFIVEEFVHGFKRLSLNATSVLLTWACSYVEKRALSHSLVSKSQTTLRTMIELLSALLDAQGTCLLMAPAATETFDKGYRRLYDVREELQMAYIALDEANQLLMPSLIKYDQAWRSHRQQQKSTIDSAPAASKWASIYSQSSNSKYSLELLTI